jgi:acylphosphatase
MVEMRIEIRGRKVQDVGYRALVTSRALRLNPKRFDIRNLEDNKGEGVEVLIGDNRAKAYRLYNDLMAGQKPKYAKVKSINRPMPHRGYIPTTDRFVATNFPVYVAEQIYKFVQEGKSLGATLKAVGKAMRALTIEVQGMGRGVEDIGKGVQELLKKVPSN